MKAVVATAYAMSMVPAKIATLNFVARELVGSYVRDTSGLRSFVGSSPRDSGTWEFAAMRKRIADTLYRRSEGMVQPKTSDFTMRADLTPLLSLLNQNVGRIFAGYSFGNGEAQLDEVNALK